MMRDVLMALVVFGSIFGIVFVIFTARNRERLAMIEKGLNPLEYKPKSNNTGMLKWALLIIGLGLGFFVGSLIENYTTISEEPVYFGAVLFFGGLGLFIAYLMGKKKKEE